MLTAQDIFHRYQAKLAEFNKTADITLIGHSLFDMWENTEKNLTLKGQSVVNLGLSGTSTRQYLDVIAAPQYIRHLGRRVFVFLGVNDIAKEPAYSPQQVLDWIAAIYQQIQSVAQPDTRYFLLEATPINQINTVTNAQIQAMNAHFRTHCPAPFVFVPTYDRFLDHNGNLAAELTLDGLHFNAKGYAILREILEAAL